MNRLLTVLVLTAGIGARSVASAQTAPPPPPASNGVAPSVAGWTTVGAGAGFGLGFYLGFRAFDQARYAERKIMTAAVAGAAAGALGGYLIGRLRSDNRRANSPSRATEAVIGTPGWMPVDGSFTLRGDLDTGPKATRTIHHGVK